MIRKILLMAVSILLVFSVCGTAAAGDLPIKASESDGDYSVRYTYISYTSCNFAIASNGKASMSASISGYSNVSSVRICGYLQRYNGGWQTVKSLNVLTSGSYGVMTKTWYVSQGYQYRWLVYYYAYSGSNTESTSDSLYRNFY